MGNLKYKESAQGTFYHLYNRGNQKRNIFLEEEDYKHYLQRMVKAGRENDYTIIAYCLMPNHMHLIVRQNKETPPARLVSSIHMSYAMMFNKKYKMAGHLFQNRFKQKIIDSDDYLRNLIIYVHLNPVKAGICTFPKEYKWSSYLEYAWSGKADHSRSICGQDVVEMYGIRERDFEKFIRLAGNISEEDAFDFCLISSIRTGCL